MGIKGKLYNLGSNKLLKKNEFFSFKLYQLLKNVVLIYVQTNFNLYK